MNEANAMSDEMAKGVRFELVVKSGTSHDLNDPEKKVGTCFELIDPRCSRPMLF